MEPLPDDRFHAMADALWLAKHGKRGCKFCEQLARKLVRKGVTLPAPLVPRAG